MDIENLEKKHNIIVIDEDFIGNVDNLKNYFIDNLAYNLQSNEDIENKIGNINITRDILEDLQDCYDDTVVRVCYNPMGTYYIADSLDR